MSVGNTAVSGLVCFLLLVAVLWALPKESAPTSSLIGSSQKADGGPNTHRSKTTGQDSRVPSEPLSAKTEPTRDLPDPSKTGARAPTVTTHSDPGVQTALDQLRKEALRRAETSSAGVPPTPVPSALPAEKLDPNHESQPQQGSGSSPSVRPSTPLKAGVLSVADTSVILSAGRLAGVKKGDSFQLLRNQVVVATLTVGEVSDQYCRAALPSSVRCQVGDVLERKQK